MSHPILWVPDDCGVPTPVLNLTQPAFAVMIDDAELARVADEFVLGAVQGPPLSAATRSALERSRLGRALLLSSGTYLSGMGTYLLKLGPEALGPDADPIDLRLAVSFPALCIRIRLQDTVTLIVDELRRKLETEGRRPLSFINIGGGPGADSFNSLLVIQTNYPALLSSRSIEISVLDVDDSGPAFGARVIEGLRGSGQPLRNVGVSFRTVKYNWCEHDAERRLRGAVDPSAITVISSEGGIFEYGDDDTVITNLKNLHAATADDAIIVGSVTRPGKALDALLGPTRAALRPRSIDTFASLTTRAGWQIGEVIERPLCYAVRMHKANRGPVDPLVR